MKAKAIFVYFMLVIVVLLFLFWGLTLISWPIEKARKALSKEIDSILMD
jgi:hypothetical protein